MRCAEVCLHVFRTIALASTADDFCAGPEKHSALRSWFQELSNHAEKAAAHDREEFLKWSSIRHSLTGKNLMEQDVAYIIALALEASVYVIAVPDGGQFAQVKCYAEAGMTLH